MKAIQDEIQSLESAIERSQTKKEVLENIQDFLEPLELTKVSLNVSYFYVWKNEPYNTADLTFQAPLDSKPEEVDKIIFALDEMGYAPTDGMYGGWSYGYQVITSNKILIPEINTEIRITVKFPKIKDERFRLEIDTKSVETEDSYIVSCKEGA